MASSEIFVKKAVPERTTQKLKERTIPELMDFGIVNLDKPKGPTSHQVSDYVKQILGINRAGHSGTLDPKVSGVQPIALGKATRIAEFLLHSPKEYVGIMHLHKPVEKEEVQKAVRNFVGKIQQLPPLKSAVKRQLRIREIYEFEILEQSEQEVLFRVKCQAGTYIRKLIFDLGKALGIGAHMAELRRIRAGPFTEKDNLVTLNDLADAFHFYQKENNQKFLRYCIQPIETAVRDFPKCWVLDTAITSLSHGRDLAVPGISKLENFRKGESVAILNQEDRLIAMGEAVMSAVEVNTQDKGIAVKLKKVFVEEQ